MKTTIRKWGNSPAVRLPTAIIRTAEFNLEQSVNIIATRGRIIIEPISAPEYDLDQLLAAITSKNLQPEADFGPPTGVEAL